MWLVKCVKSLISEDCAKVDMLNSLKNCSIALSLYNFITLAKIEVKNIRLSVYEILGVFVNT